MHIILSIPDDTYEMTVQTNSHSETFHIDAIHYMREIFLRNVPAGDNFDAKYRVLKEQATSIDTLNLPVRIRKALLAANIATIQTLLKHSRKSLLAVKGLGESSLDVLTEALQKSGYDVHSILYPGISKDEIEAAKLDPDSVFNLDIEKALANKLYRAGVKQIGELKELSSDDLMGISGFQYSDFAKIVMALEKI